VPPSELNTASLLRVTKLFQVDAEVIWRKEICQCTLLSASPTGEAVTKGSSFEILAPIGLGQSYPLFPPSIAVIYQTPTYHAM
jgi:hypothetical protein